MGQQPSKSREVARLEELRATCKEVNRHLDRVLLLLAAEQAAGIPPATSSTVAHWDALFAYLRLLEMKDEKDGIFARLLSRGGAPPPMPDPTPPLRLPPLPPDAAEAEATLSLPSCCKEEPGTPVYGASRQADMQAGASGSSTSKVGAPPGSGEFSEAAQLLAAEPGRPVAGLRRRQGHGWTRPA